ncbi:MAG: pyruvate formate lyase-activating protein [Clostridia bacterium]|nr:pyruvate formate lyase-activating protein [Clostridia bacterium]
MAYNYGRDELKGNIRSLETFGLVDGPGVRFVVFMQGCALRCRYCHNPETWAGGGSPWTVRQLFDKAWRYRAYWKNNGGITVSGGEPLLQIEFLTEFFSMAKKHGINTAVDTAGQPFCRDEEWLANFDALMCLTDLFILDIKEWDEQRHISLTGKTNSNIKDMARYLSDNGKAMWIRHVLVPDLTDREDDLRGMSDFIASLSTVEKVEVLPYHAFGIPSWEKLGLDYSLKDAQAPTEEQIKRAEELLKVSDYK